MGSKYFKKYPGQKKWRSGQRRRNYERSTFGNRLDGHRFFTWKEKLLIMWHIIPDRWLAWLLKSSANGIQSKRWRINNNYEGVCGK